MELTEKDKNIAWQAYLTLPEWGEIGGDGFRNRTLQSQRAFAAVSAVLELRDQGHEALRKAAQRVIACQKLHPTNNIDWKRTLEALEAALTPADPETPTEHAEQDEEIAYRARQIWRRFVGIPITEPYDKEFQWLVDLLSGKEAPKRSLTEVCDELRNLEPPTKPVAFSDSRPEDEQLARDMHEAYGVVHDHQKGLGAKELLAELWGIKAAMQGCLSSRNLVALPDVEKAVRKAVSAAGYGCSEPHTSDCMVKAILARLKPEPAKQERVTVKLVKQAIGHDMWNIFLDGKDCQVQFLEEKDAERYANGLRAEIAEKGAEG